jgi:hypothetical protein
MPDLFLLHVYHGYRRGGEAFNPLACKGAGNVKLDFGRAIATLQVIDRRI